MWEIFFKTIGFLPWLHRVTWSTVGGGEQTQWQIAVIPVLKKPWQKLSFDASLVYRKIIWQANKNKETNSTRVRPTLTRTKFVGIICTSAALKAKLWGLRTTTLNWIILRNFALRFIELCSHQANHKVSGSCHHCVPKMALLQGSCLPSERQELPGSS